MKTDILNRICVDTQFFRQAVDIILSDQSHDPVVFRDRLDEVWVAASRLYLDQAELHSYHMDDPGAGESADERDAVSHFREDCAATEQRIRSKLRSYLEQLTIWDQFNTTYAIPVSRGLKCKEDYILALSLHLPEIYSETIRLEYCAHRLLIYPSEALLSVAMLSAEHLGKNHISFVFPALEWLTEDDAWA